MLVFVRRHALLTSIIRKYSASNELVGAGTSTGIEHAFQQQQLGQRNKQDFKNYKCIDYLNFNKYSFYDKENNILENRVKQPSNKVPDVEPRFK